LAVVRGATALAVGLAVVLLPAAPARADTIRELQWHLDAVKAPQAQAISRGDGVVVAVVDTGVDADHPDLAGAVLPGRSFVSDPDAHLDPVGHGTAMAGLIAARGGGPNNALGIAPGAQILPVKIADGTRQSSAEPIRWAVDNGASVINLSFGRDQVGTNPADEADAVAYALAHDVVVVSSAGNTDNVSVGNAFAAMPGVIGVGGIARSGQHFIGSSTGAFVAVSAPAENVASTFPRAVATSGYAKASGSSDAAAIVSGIAALIRSEYPDMDAANVVNRILLSAVDQGAPGRDPEFGFGSVDAERALTLDIPTVAENPLGAAAPTGPGQPGSPDLDGSDEGNAFGRAMVLIGLLFGGLLCVGLVILIVVLIRRSGRRRGPPAYGGGGPPQAYGGGGPPQTYPPPQYQSPQYQQPPGYPPQGYPPQSPPPGPQYGQPPR
jgi:type VII secretion-associated serine protease mycosin